MTLSETINISWHVSDILLRAKDQDLDLSKEKALEILHDLKNNHDSTIGINWDVIDEHLYLATR